MPSIVLNLGERKPLIRSRIRGPKTLFIYPTVNWPAQIGQPEPCIPLDIEIQTHVKYGEAQVDNAFPLPNNGYSGTFSGDEIQVDCWYTPAQGLAVPYNQYIINAGVIPGFHDDFSSKYTNKWQAQAAIRGWGPFVIPNFAKEVRVVTELYGWLLLLERALVGAVNQAVVHYDFAEFLDWRPIPQYAARWLTAIYYYPYTLSALSGFPLTVEFR